MDIGILGWDEIEEETVDLVQLAVDMELSPFLFTLQDIRCDMTASVPKLLAKGRLLDELTVIISRAQIRPDFWQEDLERLWSLDILHLPVVDNPRRFFETESKLITMQKLRMGGLNVPTTAQCGTLKQVVEMTNQFGGQVVLKPSYGYGGTDVERVELPFDNDSRGRVEQLLYQYGTLLVQPYIPHPQGDVRVTIIGQKVAFCFRRVPNTKTWKANVAQGADVILDYEPSKEILEASLEASRIMGTGIVGVDVVETNGSYVILEVNNVPGWYPLPPAQRVQTAKEIILYALSTVKALS